MVVEAHIATWLGWAKSGFGLITGLRRLFKQHPGVSIVPISSLYVETAQPDGKILTHIRLVVSVSNMREVGLVILTAECHVRWHGTVRTPFFQESVLPTRSHLKEHISFLFARNLGKPRWCKLILTDQFDKKHKKWIRLRYGAPHDPY